MLSQLYPLLLCNVFFGESLLKKLGDETDVNVSSRAILLGLFRRYVSGLGEGVSLRWFKCWTLSPPVKSKGEGLIDRCSLPVLLSVVELRTSVDRDRSELSLLTLLPLPTLPLAPSNGTSHNLKRMNTLCKF